MTKKDLSIAIIDNGLNNFFFNPGKLRFDIEITPELKVINRNKNSKDISFHGTVCAAIIKKFSNDVCYGSIKILNNENLSSCNQLVKAINYCWQNHIKLIHISLGSFFPRDFFSIKTIINEAVNEGIIIVAALSNQYYYTYPASLSNVIGVKADNSGILKDREYVYNVCPADGIEITTFLKHSYKMILQDMKPSFFNKDLKIKGISNSFVTPYITSIVFNLLLKKPDSNVEEIKRKLIKKNIRIKHVFIYT